MQPLLRPSNHLTGKLPCMRRTANAPKVAKAAALAWQPIGARWNLYMSTSNVIDLELDELPVPRYGFASPTQTGQSGARHPEPRQTYATLQTPTPQIVAEILQAATQGDLYKVTYYGSSYDLNVGDYDRRCAIHLASAEGQTLIVKFLVSNGCNVNCEDRFGNTPLREALRGNHTEVAKILQDAGAKMGQASAEIDGEVMRLVATNDIAKLSQLLSAGASANCKDHDGRTPLHIAVAEGHKECVALLLSKGADVNVQDRWQNTPLSEAMRTGIRVGKDDVTDMLMRSGAVVPMKDGEQISEHFLWILVPAQVVMIVLFGVFVQYGPGPAPVTSNSGVYPVVKGMAANTSRLVSAAINDNFYQKYPFYQDIHVMIFIGFGYLMTFLRKYGYSAVGLTFLMGAFVMQWHILNEGFWHRVFEGTFNSYIEIDFMNFMRTDFCAGAVLISFGALLGKASPTQMLFIMIFEVIFYNINEQIGLKLGISDIGGSYVIHMFGAYFGLGCSWILSPKSARGRSDNAAVYHSDLFATIGTIFLWMYWPSFNAGPQASATGAHRAVINTLLGLSGSCLSAFAWSKFYRVEKKFSMVDIQNASIAGGVALGAVADLMVYPVGAVILGSVAGWLSVYGFTTVTPFLEKYIGLHDTCGVHNLHGMPSILSAVSACILAAVAKPDVYGDDLSVYPARLRAAPNNRSADYQAQMQVAFLFITIGVSAISGFLVGWAATYEFFDPMHDGHLFLDDESWEVPRLETPYYFDRRGEIGQHAQAPAAASVVVDIAQRAAAAPPPPTPDNMQRIASVLATLQQEITAARSQGKSKAF
jgi:ammonium transporter Rh